MFIKLYSSNCIDVDLYSFEGVFFKFKKKRFYVCSMYNANVVHSIYLVYYILANLTTLGSN